MVMFSVNRFRSFLLLLLVSTVLVLAGFIYKNLGKLPQSISVDITSDGVNVGIKNFHLMEEEDGRKKWELEANEAEIINANDITQLKDVRVTFFQEGRESVTLRADRGTVKNKTRNIEAFGNVVISDGKYILKSDQLSCQWNSKLVAAEGFVEIIGKMYNVTGTGMISNLKEESIEILKNVKMTIYPKEDG